MRTVAWTTAATPLMMRCPVCEATYVQQCDPVMGKLTAGEPVRVMGDPVVALTQPNWNDIPTRVLGLKETYRNCTPLEQSFTFNHAQQVQKGSKVTKSTTLSTTAKIEVKVGFELIVKGDSTFGFSQTFGVNDANEQSFQTTDTLTTSLPLKAEKAGKTVIEHWWVERNTPVGFTGTVVLDAAVSQNREGVLTLTQVLPNVADRTFVFAGQITTAQFLEGQTNVVFTPLTPAQCQNSSKERLEVNRVKYTKTCTGEKCVLDPS